MDKHWAYCSACDRTVEVAVEPTGRTDPATGDPEERIVCLEVGETCTGALCPITDIAPEEMFRRAEGLRERADRKE